MSALLWAFGFRLRLDPVAAFQRIGRFAGQRRDLALQPPDTLDMQSGTRHPAQVTGRGEDLVEAGLAGPDGLVLSDLDAPALAPLKAAVRLIATMRTVLSDPLAAVCDAFATDSRPPVADLMRLGLAHCACSGAVAAEMNPATARHLAQPAGPGLSIGNRDFLRFDLYLALATGFGKELAAVLDSRSRVRGIGDAQGRRMIG